MATKDSPPIAERSAELQALNDCDLHCQHMQRNVEALAAAIVACIKVGGPHMNEKIERLAEMASDAAFEAANIVNSHAEQFGVNHKD